MSVPVAGIDPLALELARALGIDPSKTTRFCIVVDAEEVCMLHVRRQVHNDDLAVLTDAIKRHRVPGVKVREVGNFEVADDCSIVVTPRDEMVDLQKKQNESLRQIAGYT